MDVVVRGGTVVTPTGIDLSDVAIRDGKFVSIGPDLARATATIDATDRLVLPGAIERHTHLHHWGAGPVEATALGNVLVQARAHGLLAGDLETLRALVRTTQDLRRYEPRASSVGSGY